MGSAYFFWNISLKDILWVRSILIVLASFLSSFIFTYFHLDISAFLSKLVGVSLILVGLYGIHEISEEREERLKSKDKKKPNVINSYYAIFSTGLIQGKLIWFFEIISTQLATFLFHT